ncbi:MAG TPA: cell division protein FtsL [bacterium]|nr:cell division protein FtsL [bacterium]
MRTAFMPQTRIRRRGLAVTQKLKMRRLLKGALVYVALIFVFSLGYVWTRVQVVETGYRLRSLEVSRNKLKEDNRSLMVEAATLRSPQRLEQIAKQMGLQRPTESQIVYLKKEKP